MGILPGVEEKVDELLRLSFLWAIGDGGDSDEDNGGGNDDDCGGWWWWWRR